MFNFDQAPYFDDFNEEKKFLKVPYIPGVAVQARELSQIQSILQNQIGRFAANIFQNGAMVVPGQITLDVNYQFVRLNPLLTGTAINLSLIDPTASQNQGVSIVLQGANSKAQATVVRVVPAEGNDPPTAYIKYIASGTNITSNTSNSIFQPGEMLSVSTTTASGATSITSFAFVASDQPASATSTAGSAASIQQGVYYINGYFCLVDAQTIILDKYTNLPTYRVGLTITENLITSTDDESLLDNATGTPNFNAPGAHRYQILLTLDKRALTDTNDSAFIELLRVTNGVPQAMVTDTQYSIIEQKIAKGIADQSGNFTVTPFKIDIFEDLNDGTNGGLYTAAQGGDETQLAVGLEPATAYVDGFRIQTLATKYVNVAKARETALDQNSVTRAYLGNYIYVDNLYNFPTYDSDVTINLYLQKITSNGNAPATQIGTANVRNVEYFSGTIGNAHCIYKLYLFNINLTGSYTINDVRSLYVASGGSDVASTGDVLSQLQILNPSGQFAIGTADSTNSEIVITYDPVSGLMLTEPGSANTNIPNKGTITVSGVTGTVASRTKLFDVGHNILIYPLPQQIVKTVKDLANANDTTYLFRQTFTQNVAAAGTVSFNCSSNQQFEAFSPQDYMAVFTTGANAGQMIDLSSSFTSPTETSVSFTVPASGNLKFSATLTNKLAVQKSKSKTSGTLNVTGSSGAPVAKTISLGTADIFSLDSVKTASGKDITDLYTLDNGQRDNSYELGSITQVSGGSITQNITIKFTYFQHGPGDYFSVDSYTDIDYAEIPTYKSQATGVTYNLRDCLDYRPRRDNSGTTYSTAGKIVKPNTDIRADYQYYLARIDKIYLTSSGSFGVVRGTASLNPVPPQDPKDGMVLYILSLGPFTFGPRDVHTQMIDNRGYTMRDIGSLVTRISNLEYYNSLNLLEQSTQNLSITDATTGLDRFKNGFVVDPFKGHNIGDVFNADYHCSIDPQNGILRPQFKANNLAFEYVASRSTGVRLTGDYLTLPYNEVAFVSQPLASHVETVNPYQVYQWVGTVTLNPPSDTWKDTEYRPDIVVNNDTLFDNIVNLADASGVDGTTWNNWVTDWTGQSVTDVGSPTSATTSTTNADGSVVRQTVTTQNQNVTTTSQQTRTGTTTTFVPQVVSTTVDDKIVNISVIPFMRSLWIKFSAVRLKPLTRFYPFFDGAAVSEYCKPVGTQTGNNDDPTTNLGDPLFSDGTGKLAGWFQVPNDPSTLQFKTGARQFRLSDDVNNTQAADSFGDAVFTSSGVLETHQDTITNNRTARVETTSVSQTQVVTSTTQRSVVLSDTTDVIAPPPPTATAPAPVDTGTGNSAQDAVDPNQSGSIDIGPPGTDTGTPFVFDRFNALGTWNDPLAQSFVVQGYQISVDVTSIDVYFFAKDPTLPVTVQIRTVENGYPTQTVLPLAEVTLDSPAVNISNDGSVPTKFTFPSPVTLQANTMYAFVVHSNSAAYEVFVGKLGEQVINSDRIISQSPYVGSIFKSNNAATWTADQTEDMKFVIYRAQYTTNSPGNILFQNATVPVATLGSLPFTTATGSSLIRVYHPNHGMPVGSSVTLTLPSSEFPLSYNGIPVSAIVNTTAGQPTTGQGTHVIQHVELDYYMFDAGTNANASGAVGADGITATQNYQMDVLYPLVQEIIPPNTTASWGIVTTSGKSVDGTQTPYLKDSTFASIIENSNVVFNSPRLVASAVNEPSGATEFDKKTLILQGTLVTQLDNVSPIIDLARMAAIIIGNRIDSPTSATRNVTGFDSGNHFVDETASTGGSASAKYMCRRVGLASPSIGVTVYLTCNIPPAANVALYYRYLSPYDAGVIESAPWVLMNPVAGSDTSKAQSPSDFRDYSWIVDNVPQFVAFEVKIVMTSTDTTQAPQCQQLRAIALAT